MIDVMPPRKWQETKMAEHPITPEETGTDEAITKLYWAMCSALAEAAGAPALLVPLRSALASAGLRIVEAAKEKTIFRDMGRSHDRI